MGKLDLIEGQPEYLADNPKKRKKPHEPDQGENTGEHMGKGKKPRKPRKPRDNTAMQIDSSQPLMASQPWMVPQQWKALNGQSFISPLASSFPIPAIPVLPPAVHLTTMASGSDGSRSLLPTEPLRPPKKAKAPRYSNFTSAGNSVCPLCGGPKHSLPDCPAAKGGVEK